MGTQQRNGFTPPGPFQKVNVPNSGVEFRGDPMDPAGNAQNVEELRRAMNENSVYLNRVDWGNGGGGLRWATIVIAASDSTPVNKNTADYICTGTNDEVVINNAIAILFALRPGTSGIGRIVLLEGTYNLGAALTANTFGARHLVIQGMGGSGIDTTIPATMLKATGTAAMQFFGSNVSAGSALTVMDLGMQNNTGAVATISNTDVTTDLRNCWIKNAAAGAVNIQDTIGTSGASRVQGNYINGAGGIFIDVGPGVDQPIIVSGNIIHSAGNNAIECGSQIGTVPTYIIEDNHLTGNGTGKGVVVKGNSTEDCVVSGNLIRSFATGVEMGGHQQLCAGNLIESCTTGYTTGADSRYPGVLGNQFSSCTTAVVLTNSAPNPSVLANKMNLCTTGVSIAAGVSDAAVFGNDTFGCATPLSDAGTNTRTDATNVTTNLGSSVSIDANARVGVRKNTAGSTFKRRRINFIEGSNVTLTLADDAGNEEVDLTIAVAGGSSPQIKTNGSVVGAQPIINFINGSSITITAVDTGTQIDLTINSAGGGGASPAINEFNHLNMR